MSEVVTKNAVCEPTTFKPHPTIVQGVELILTGLEELYGLIRTPDMATTPERVARMYAELCVGLQEDPKEFLKVRMPAPNPPNLIVTSGIEFISVCRHHLAIIEGLAYVGYLPNTEIVGLSKIGRVVDTFAKRPQVQEEMTNQIADMINCELQPQGVIVVISAKHDCMCTRGIRKQNSTTQTSAVRGVFRTNIAGCKEEFFNLLRLGYDVN